MIDTWRDLERERVWFFGAREGFRPRFPSIWYTLDDISPHVGLESVGRLDSNTGDAYTLERGTFLEIEFGPLDSELLRRA